MDSIQLLISGYLDGELSEEERGRLAGLLETDAEALDRFVFNGFIHWQLLDWMDQEPAYGGSIAGDFDAMEAALDPVGRPGLDAVNTASNNGAMLARAKHASTARKLRALWGIAAIAATLLIGASISIVSYIVSSRPMFVGQLTDATNCRWDADQVAVAVGTPFYDGQELKLLQGTAVITFASGAKLRLEGPASLQINSAMEVQLDSGSIAVKVPRQAAGFAVNSSLARFVDMGTAFTLKLNRDKAFDLYVFDGMVEMRIDERFGAKAHLPMNVSAVHAMHFDVAAGEKPLPFNQGEQMPF